jgi:hypothetical protein
MSVSDPGTKVPSINDLDPLDRPIFGALAIGKVIGLSERSARWFLDKHALDADEFAGRWCSTTPRRILNSVLKPEGQTATKTEDTAA